MLIKVCLAFESRIYHLNVRWTTMNFTKAYSKKSETNKQTNKQTTLDDIDRFSFNRLFLILKKSNFE